MSPKVLSTASKLRMEQEAAAEAAAKKKKMAKKRKKMSILTHHHHDEGEGDEGVLTTSSSSGGNNHHHHHHHDLHGEKSRRRGSSSTAAASAAAAEPASTHDEKEKPTQKQQQQQQHRDLSTTSSDVHQEGSRRRGSSGTTTAAAAASAAPAASDHDEKKPQQQQQQQQQPQQRDHGKDHHHHQDDDNNNNNKNQDDDNTTSRRRSRIRLFQWKTKGKKRKRANPAAVAAGTGSSSNANRADDGVFADPAPAATPANNNTTTERNNMPTTATEKQAPPTTSAAIAAAAATATAPTIGKSKAATRTTTTVGKSSSSSAKTATTTTSAQLSPPPPPRRRRRQQKSAATVTSAAATGTTTTTTTRTCSPTVTQKKKNRRKRPRLFRIKTGCVVSIREDKQQQQSTMMLPVWTDPHPIYDSGYALIGRTIRCSVPRQQKQQKQQPQQKQQDTQKHSKNTPSVLEGEIVRYLGTSSSSCFRVELLIDRKQMECFPGLLHDLEPDEDLSSLLLSSSSSQKKKRQQQSLRYEYQIRGLHKAIVEITLQLPPFIMMPSSSSDGGGSGGGWKWVIHKQVPPKLFRHTATAAASSSSSQQQHKPSQTTTTVHKTTTTAKTKNGTTASTVNGTTTTTTATTAATNGIATSSHDAAEKKGAATAPIRTKTTSTTTTTTTTTAPRLSKKPRHVGDGHDTPEQQIRNWRWLAGRYHEDTSFRVGQVLSVTPNTAATSAAAAAGTTTARKTSASSSSSLAKVTLQRLVLPQDTITSNNAMIMGGGSQPPLPPFLGIKNGTWWDRSNGDAARAVLLKEEAAGAAPTTITVPIEHLVVMGRKLVERRATTHDNRHETEDRNDDVLYVEYSYNREQNVFLRLGQGEHAAGTTNNGEREPKTNHLRSFCHGCRREILQDNDDAAAARSCTSESCPARSNGADASSGPWWCRECLDSLSKPSLKKEENDDEGDKGVLLPCCAGLCDCPDCCSLRGWELQEQLFTAVCDATVKGSLDGDDDDDNDEDAKKQQHPLLRAACMAAKARPVDFALPNNFLDVQALPIPLAKPCTRIQKKATSTSGSGTKRKRSPKSPKSGRPRTPTPRNTNNDKDGLERKKATFEKEERREEEVEDYSVFKPTCARTLDCQPSRIARNSSSTSSSSLANGTSHTASPRERPRNLRKMESRTLITETKTDSAKASSSSRAARANQRRLLKDINHMGGLTVDTLASREPQLRFDRSGIHAWGVFADHDIAAGEMIIEYRGELIGNAVAERREIEYEHAKIGSDYMFRIDNYNVCDATKQGNVARFINASCDPNCYTKIITLDGIKRIVIYAKKDIQAGDELCYDYKFPLEYDESKRIPCHCGARECRGFMNWDKRFVIPPASLSKLAPPPSSPEQQQTRINDSHNKPLKCASD